MDSLVIFSCKSILVGSLKQGEVRLELATNIPAGFLHDDREEVKAILGQGYMTSMIQGNLSRSVLILTDKRIYHRGRVFRRVGNSFTSSKTEGVVNTRSVTGTKFEEFNATALIVLAILFGVAALVLGAIASEEESAAIYASIFGVAAIGAWLGYYKARRRFFCVEYAGGGLATDARWYSEKEMHDFMRAVSQLKDAQESG